MTTASRATGTAPRRPRTRRAIAVAGTACGLIPWIVAPAWAAFAQIAQTSSTSFATYVVPTPTGIACSGLSSQVNSKITWTAVAPAPGDTVVYAVTAPSGGTTTTASTSYSLPAVTLVPGQYAVRTQISSGWRSQPATITVGLTVLGILYTCSVP